MTPTGLASVSSASVYKTALLPHAPLPQGFYDRDTLQVARDLLGCQLVRWHQGKMMVAHIVETEA